MQIHTIDLKFQNLSQSIAAYLVVGPDGPVLIETGPTSTLETLKAGIAQHGYAARDIRHVLVTHIHLDHAGALGWWAQEGAQVYVHERGAPHMIDPSRLLASAGRIYGDKMDELWGEFLPVPAERLTVVRDGDAIGAGGLTFSALDTPGHARHHHVYRLGDIAFVGDAAGIRVPDSPFIDVPAPPPEFDLETWKETIARLDAARFTTIYPTHFGVVNEPRPHFERLRGVLIDTAEFVRSKYEEEVDRDEIVELYRAWSRERAQRSGLSPDLIERYESTSPSFMTVDGILRYWRKRTS